MILTLTTACLNVAYGDASEIIRSTTIVIDMKAGGKVSAAASINCYENCTSLGFTSLVIEENRNGSWVVVASKGSDLSTGYSHGTSLSYNGTAGKTYRARATAKATFNGTTEWRYPEAGEVVAVP